MELYQKQKDIEEHQKNVSIMMQRIENKPFLTLTMIDTLITEMYRLNCFEEVLMSAVIDKCLETDKKAFFDKYLLEDTCELVMRRGKVVYPYQGKYDFKRYRILVDYYTDNWLYIVPIEIVLKLAEQYPEIKSSILPNRENKQTNSYTTYKHHSGGGGWGTKCGTEYVSKHYRTGHWRRCKSGKVVWVNASIISGHPRTY